MKYQLTSTVFFNHCFDKRRFQSFLHWFFKKSHHGHYRLLKFLEKIQLLGFHSATKAGFSISIDDLKIPASKPSVLLTAENRVFDTDLQFMSGNLTTIERYQCILEIWNRTSEKLKYQVLQSFKFSDFFNPVYFMAFSGARGNISQIRQLVGMRGLMADPQGQIIDFPIRSNFREGLTLTEYLISCSGARKGIVDTALRTAASGYLTRRLVDVAHQVIISQIDCHSSHGIFVEDLYDHQKKILSLKQRLVGRILAETLICPKGDTSRTRRQPSKYFIIGSKNQEISKQISQKICKIWQKVQIRSPLTCESAKFVCQFCYGWNLAEGQLVSIGEAVGVLAAQSIGEPGTQLTMRTFHTGGVFTGMLLDQTYAPFTGKIHYFSSCSGLLIRTQQGKIAYLSKNNGTFQIKKNQQEIRKKIQFQSGSLLYVKEGENILKTQLMAELPFFEKENTFENEQEVLSLNSGEIYFENIIFLEKTIFDFLKEQTKNCVQGLSKFWILSAQFFKQKNSFFQKLDLIDKSVPFTQVILNLHYEQDRGTKLCAIYSIFFKNIGYLCKQKKTSTSVYPWPVVPVGYSTPQGGSHWPLPFRVQSFTLIPYFHQKFLKLHIKNFLISENAINKMQFQKKALLLFLNAFYNIFSEFPLKTEGKYKKINQNLFIIFINRQGISQYKKKNFSFQKIFDYFCYIRCGSFTMEKRGRAPLGMQTLLKNLHPHWIRQRWKVQPRILHWKNLPIFVQKYIFLTRFLENLNIQKKISIGNNPKILQYKFQNQTFPHQSKCFLWKFQKRKNLLKIGENVYIRILLCLKRNNQKSTDLQISISLIEKYSKNIYFQEIIKNRFLSCLPVWNRGRGTDLNNIASNILEWRFFGQKSENPYSTYFKNFLQKKRSLSFQNNDFSVFPSFQNCVAFGVPEENIFLLEEILPYSILTGVTGIDSNSQAQKALPVPSLMGIGTGVGLRLRKHGQASKGGRSTRRHATHLGYGRAHVHPIGAVELELGRSFRADDQLPPLEASRYSICNSIYLKKMNFTKLQKKNIDFFFNVYCFLFKNFYFLKNFQTRFTNRKFQKPIQKFLELQMELSKKKIFKKNIRKKSSLQKNRTFLNIQNLLKIQTNKYNQQVESISKKSLISLQNRIQNDFQNYKIRYLKSAIPEKKDSTAPYADLPTPAAYLPAEGKGWTGKGYPTGHKGCGFAFAPRGGGKGQVFKKNLKKTFFVFSSPTPDLTPTDAPLAARRCPEGGRALRGRAVPTGEGKVSDGTECWTFTLNDRNNLYSVNLAEGYSESQKLFRTHKNLKFLLFTQIKIILNDWRCLKKEQLKKKFFSFFEIQISNAKFELTIPYLKKKFQIRLFELKLINILPLKFHLKLLNSTYSQKLQLIKIKHLNRNLFSKIKKINLQIIQKNFFSSFETLVFFRFFLFLTSSEILDPQIRKHKNNLLFTNNDNYFSQKVFYVQNKLSFKGIQHFSVPVGGLPHLSWSPAPYSCTFTKGKAPYMGRGDSPLEGLPRLRVRLPQKKKFCLSINKFLRKDNLKRIPGLLFRGGEKFTNNHFIFREGQLVAKTYNTFLFRKATNYLLNDQSILYAHHGEIILKNQHLCSVFYNQSKIGDIVQGIPKIEEIFEARKKSKYKLPIFYNDCQFSEKKISKSLQNLQKSIVNNIQRIYCGQGIYISDKHIEIIVRQMTSNVLILDPGQTGLLCGEIVALQWIYRINSKKNSSQIIYEPILLGMTKTCLETSSFLSAASFQETTRILSRAALQNQIDFIRGLKQNVILGNLLPIGTGYF
uniref:DNA-directed RNA polymerase n=1 Tax=Udotea flabellum TaxID=170437 RepID=A0A386B1P0_9CHLO|nr:RNA polymerase b-subunit [Udotea flabellum]AYC65625.1 RNA polymerase b-subunit [Udotea flabellum]